MRPAADAPSIPEFMPPNRRRTFKAKENYMEKVMAVYDVDPVYARRFADVVNQKEKVPFEVIPFTTLEALKEYVKKHSVEILLISDSMPRELIEGLKVNSVVALAEGETVNSSDSYPSVYKYQAAPSGKTEFMMR